MQAVGHFWPRLGTPMPGRPHLSPAWRPGWHDPDHLTSHSAHRDVSSPCSDRVSRPPNADFSATSDSVSDTKPSSSSQWTAPIARCGRLQPLATVLGVSPVFGAVLSASSRRRRVDHRLESAASSAPETSPRWPPTLVVCHLPPVPSLARSLLSEGDEPAEAASPRMNAPPSEDGFACAAGVASFPQLKESASLHDSRQAGDRTCHRLDRPSPKSATVPVGWSHAADSSRSPGRASPILSTSPRSMTVWPRSASARTNPLRRDFRRACAAPDSPTIGRLVAYRRAISPCSIRCVSPLGGNTSSSLRRVPCRVIGSGASWQ